MSTHLAFRRQPVPGQVAQRLQSMTLPAPTRGLILSENFGFMQPGAALVSDNWVPTMRGAKLRGGHIRWCDLHALDGPVPPVPSASRKPVISAFEYASGNVQRMFAAQATKLFDVTAATPTLVKSGQASGNWSAAQITNASGENHLIAVNDAGDWPLRYNGTVWTTLDAGGTPPLITGPAGPVVAGKNLVYVWKYRNRLFFIELNSMNAWFLPLNSIGGVLSLIPLAGAATKGGKLLFGASWSVDAGDGTDDKCVFVTDLGEVLIFTGSNPADAANWRQEGRYQIDKPMGQNAHVSLGGDLLIATVDGIVPVSAAITKTAEALDLAMITRNIRSMWRAEAVDKRAYPWSMKRWDEYGGLFVTWPYGKGANKLCAVVNTGTGAWTRFVGWDATCFIRMRGDMFFGNQDGIVMQADRTGYDDGVPYVAKLVGGWSVFQQQSMTTVWHQARASFESSASQPFQPQLAACVDFNITLPAPPPPGPDPGPADVWDEGKWDEMVWDGEPRGKPPVRNTLWRSIGRTGYTHAPVVQVTIAQEAKPDVELIAIDCTFERGGVNV